MTKEINGYKIGPHANLTGAYLTDANLTGAKLSNVNLSDADLRLAVLSGANFTKARGIKSAKGISKKFLRVAHEVGYLIYNTTDTEEN